MPIDTPASPFSTRASVLRLMKARSAMSAMDSRRRRRAAEMSWPSFFSARRTPIGRAGWDREDFMAQNKGIISDNAQYIEQTVPCKGNNVILLLTMSDMICNAQYMKRYR